MSTDRFSATQAVGDPILACQQGNVFAAYCPQGAPVLKAYINGKETTIPQRGILTKNGHTLAQTTGMLELKVGDQKRTIIQDLSEFDIKRPEDVGIAIGTLATAPVHSVDQPSAYQPKGRLMEYAIQTTSKAESDDVYNIAIPPALAASSPKKGVIDIETADEDTVRWLAVSVVTVLGRIDETTGAATLANATGNDVDFRLTGTAAIPLTLELTDMLKNKGNRAFLREIFKRGTKLGRVWTNASGNLMVSFRGYAGLRSFLNASAYGVSNTKVSVISSAISNSNQWAGTLKSVGGRIPVLSYIIVGAIDTAEWLALPEAEQDFTDLLSILFVDISKIAISTIVGSVTAVFAIGLGLPVWGIVVAGIGAAVVVGIVLDSADNAFGITQKVKDLANKMEPSIESFVKMMVHAKPEDGKITGPVDYLMEIDTGVRQYIYDQIRWP